jgi:hypothetical protein
VAKELKYGNISVPGIPDDEPIFILRAKDALALSTILHYQSQIAGLGRLDDPMLSNLRRSIHAFGAYTGIRKLPD